MHIKNIKKGQQFIEASGCIAIILEATCDASRVENRPGFADGWEVEGKCIGGEGELGKTYQFFIADKHAHYGPNLSEYETELANDFLADTENLLQKCCCGGRPAFEKRGVCSIRAVCQKCGNKTYFDHEVYPVVREWNGVISRRSSL